jgi:TRAP transporter 4TM/12TM fusion protein
MVDTGNHEIERQPPDLGKGWWRRFILIAASIFVLYHVLYISDLLILYTPLVISRSQHLGIHLASILFLTFLLVRARKGMKTDKPPPYDVVLAFAALVIPLYYAFNFEEMYLHVGEAVLLYGISGWVLSLLLLEASRRVVGIPFTCVVAFFLFYPLLSSHLPGILYYPGISTLRLGEFYYISHQGILGRILGIGATIVVVFLLFSQLLLHSGAGKFFIDLAHSAFGTVRGGPAKMAIVASGFFGTLSGSPTGNVAATGVFTIPLMKKTGYQPHYAGAVEAVASLGGQIMPPVMGSVIFLLADFIGIPYIEVVKHAVIPAVLYYVALFVMVDQEAVRRGLRGLGRETLPSLGRTLKRGWWYGIPVAVLLYLMAVRLWTPQKSVIWAMVALVALAMFWRETRLGLMKLALASEQTLRAMLTIAVTMACAGIIVGAIQVTGIGISISRELLDISGGNLGILLLLTAITSFIMGMGVGVLGVYVVLAVVIAPSLVTVGVPPIAAHLFMFYWAMVSFITPPVAILAYVAAGFAECSPFKLGWQATRLGILAYILPFAFVFDPALLIVGTPMEIAVAVTAVAIGTVGLAFGVGGHFWGSLNWPQRIMCLGGGMLLIFGRSEVLGSSVVLMGGGAFILAVVLLWQWLLKRAKASSD